MSILCITYTWMRDVRCGDAKMPLTDGVGMLRREINIESQSERRQYYHSKRPRESGIELIEFGGMIPTSVTTAEMDVGGVKS